MASDYDHTLLAEAPKATKAQLQEGYNPEILAPKPIKSQPSLTNGHLESKENFAAPPSRSLPWWRTTKGLIIIAIAFVVVVAAVVGGAVGGTRNKHASQTLTDSAGTGSAPILSGLASAGEAQPTGIAANSTSGSSGNTQPISSSPTQPNNDPNSGQSGTGQNPNGNTASGGNPNGGQGPDGHN